jgi:P27 family predicted phage terminase small subunit
MGRRGPAKTPIAELKKRGTFRKDRHNDKVDSQLVPCLPAPPPHFDHDQKAVWHDIGQRLADKGLMTELDAQAFELLVGSYFGMREAQDQLSASDLIVYVGEQGTPIANPLVHIIAKNASMLKWCLTQFGCTPSSRTGITPARHEVKSVDPMAALLAGTKRPAKKVTKKATP